MFDESARASEERASHVLFDETARNKQNKSKKRSKEGPEGPFLTNAPIINLILQQHDVVLPIGRNRRL